MGDVMEWALSHWSFCAFVLAAFIQLTPGIKLSPLTWLGNLFLGGVRKDIKSIQQTVDENEKDRIRWEVLDFANACRNGRKHTKDEFQHIITLNGKYKALLKKTDDKNGVFDAEYEYILKLYRDRQNKNDFL
jgi:hypothetical protein